MYFTCPYLGFDGDCAEAFRTYEQVLGGKIEMMLTYGDTPMKDNLPPETHGRIVHVRMTVGSAVIMGGDAPHGSYRTPDGIMVNIQAETVDEAERIYAALSEGGKISQALQKTFWAARFAMFADRWGTPWMINCDTGE